MSQDVARLDNRSIRLVAC